LLSAAVVVALLSACRDEVVLRDADGWLELRYDCERFQPAAYSSAQRTIVRGYAVRILRQAARENRLDSLGAVTDLSNDALLEQAVASYMCSDGRLASQAEVDSARLAEIVLPAEQMPQPGTTPGFRLYGVQVHSTAPDFIAPILEEGYLSGRPDHLQLSDLRGKFVLLDFWGTWCAPCALDLLKVAKLADDFADREFAVVGILHRDRPRWALDWLDEQPTRSFPTVVDESGRIAQLYGVNGIPRYFLIDPSGRVAANAFGFSEELLERLERVVAANGS
jgi:peroxiredoxin